MQHRHLKSEDREVIQKMKDQGYTQKKIYNLLRLLSQSQTRTVVDLVSCLPLQGNSIHCI